MWRTASSICIISGSCRQVHPAKSNANTKGHFSQAFLSFSLCGKRMRDVYLFKTFLTTFLLFWVWSYHLHLPFPFSPVLEVAIFEHLSFPSTVRTELFVSSVSICPYPVKWILWFLIRKLSNWGPEMTLISQGHTVRVKFVFRLKTVWCALLLGNSAQLHFSLTISLLWGRSQWFISVCK